jgi:hypothetical protein
VVEESVFERDGESVTLKARRWVWTLETPEFVRLEDVEVPVGFISDLKMIRERVYDRRRSPFPVDLKLVRCEFTSMDGCHNSDSIATFCFGHDRAGWRSA